MKKQIAKYKKEPKPLYWIYHLDEEYTVLAGKTDIDNDILSLKIANSNDWWFHVKGMPGSHVILKAQTGLKPDKKTLEKAASVAAWHSKARKGGIVAVSGTLAKHVSKPKGAKPGLVSIRKEKTFKVRPAVP